MDSQTVSLLVNLNSQFYQTFAQGFSDTRQRIQPGVKRIIDKLPLEVNILDIGCGNGELRRALAHRGYLGNYVGIDFSEELLEIASSKLVEGKQTYYLCVNLAADDWPKQIPQISFDHILAFAVLHHLPGFELRLKTIHHVRDLLAPQGCFIHSEWQFLRNPRMRDRIQDWGRIGLTNNQVDEGDYLLDWRQGGYGLRYVHHFDEAELETLAKESGFRISQTFYSDGKGGESSLYQIWEANSDRIG